uniref:Uncharacterized protein n=1 Tax=Tanacetum cinerariifolium TaxID=118510 RepID=A0A699HG52_TANCI|nr:hypothetical protein [Tanacetum cinerariifolium]
MTYPDEVEEIVGILIEVEPLHGPTIEVIGLNTYNHDISLSSREVSSFDETKPQPQTLLNCPHLDISLGDKKGLEPPIKPYSLDSFRMKEVDHLTNHSLLSPHVESFHPKDMLYLMRRSLEVLRKFYLMILEGRFNKLSHVSSPLLSKPGEY